MPVAARGGSHLLILALLLIVAGAFRLPALGSPGYGLDEIWTAEISTGHGSQHLTFPINQILPAPDLFQLSNAPPWWKVWGRMQVTHPPLYFILLRLWMNAFGEGDWTERFFSVVSSVAAIGLLYDVVRLKNGRNVAFWACLLMAVAPLQIDYARKTRNYVLVFAGMLAVADALVRIEKLGPSRLRMLGLMIGMLATSLIHYFALGSLGGMALYAAIVFKGRVRVLVLSMFVAAGVLFAVIWGPFFYLQLPLFSLADPAAGFVKDSADGHLLRVINLVLLVPAKMLVPQANMPLCAYALALLYVVPFLLIRRRPDLLLWALLLVGTVGATALLDLSRSSLHLGFVRYIIFAGPAVYVLIPALAAEMSKPKWLRHISSAAVVGLCICFYRDAYFDPAADPHAIVQTVQPLIGPSDILVFASNGNLAWTRGVQAMMLIRYLQPIPCPIVFLDGPAPQNIKVRLQSTHSVVLFSSDVEPAAFLPGFDEHGSRSFPSWGVVTVFTPRGKI